MYRIVPLVLLALVPACHCKGTGGAGGNPPGDPQPNDAVNNPTDDDPSNPNDTTSPGPVTCISDASDIVVTPQNQTSTLTSTGQTFSFHASADTSLGAKDITQRVNWTVSRADDSPAGTIDSNGVYTPPSGTGGQVTVTASDGCISGSTTLTLQLQTTFGNPDPGTVGQFDGSTVDTTTTAHLPRIVYPENQTRFPRNIYKVLFQWQKAGNTKFRLTFTGPGSTVSIYTDGVHPDCANSSTSGCWQADATTWQAIAGSNAGGVVHFTVDGLIDGSSTTLYRGPGIDIGFSKRDVRGAIFYWSTTAAGVRRASVSDNAPEAYVVAKPVPTVLPNNTGTVKCVACHTVSRSGKKLFGWTQATSTGAFVYDVTLDPPPTPVITTQITSQKGFGTFRPDDQHVVATVGNLLEEFDAATGAKIVNLPMAAGTNPDWSPLGTQLAYSDVGGDSPANANLKTVDYNNGAWGNIRVLAAADGGTNLFPSYSPDGEYVAYARGKGGHGDSTLQLRLRKADATEPAVELVNANRAVNNCLGVTCDANGFTNGQYENNMPTWAPSGDMEWVAFNSQRPYGVVYPTGGTQQIWVAAIDPDKLGTFHPDGGLVDPSYPAFRFAFQDLTENNHRAFWTLDIREPPPDAGVVCVSSGAACTANDTCCAGLSCLPDTSGYTCQTPPADGGVCLSDGASCDQTSGPDCCSGYVCDVNSGGSGTVCQVPLN